MYKDAIYDELRQVERDVVEGERSLADQERLIVELKREGQSADHAKSELERLRKNQRLREQDRQRLLSMVQP